MKICLFGKCPPLQGGVSSRTLNAAIYAAEKYDADVTIVTNASCSSPTYRAINIGDDVEYFRRRFKSIKIEQLLPVNKTIHIPNSHDFLSRLVGRALKCCHDADMAIGWYWQPYGLAASQFSKFLKIPCHIMHAGSDIGRVSIQDTDSRETFKASFKDDFVYASRPLTKAKIHDILGNTKNEISIVNSASGLPVWFNSKRPSFPIDELIIKSTDHFNHHSLTSKTMDQLKRLNSNSLNQGHPIIGMYGKAGATKGHFDAIESLEKLAEEKVDFEVVFLLGGHPYQFKKVTEAVYNSEILRKRFKILPFVNPWQIPSFIEMCNVVLFLERDFPITFHTPQVMREVVYQGGTLVCSSEVFKKSPISASLKDGNCCFVVDHPSNTEALSRQISSAIASSENGKAGRTAKNISHQSEGNLVGRDGFIDSVLNSYY